MEIQPRLAIPVGIALVVAAGLAWSRGGGEPPAALGSGTPVVLEVFSSEGCSSCPPADEWLRSLDERQPVSGVSVLALEMHVDYWDRQGWKDPFGSAELTARQHAYASVLSDKRTYTPEVVVDGESVVQNGDEEQAAAFLRAAAAKPRARVAVERSGSEVRVAVSDVPPVPAGDTADVWLAVTESGLTSRVDAGENRGRTLSHAPVVRSLRNLGTVANGKWEGTAPLAAEWGWRARSLRAVVFVQTRGARTMLGAGAA